MLVLNNRFDRGSLRLIQNYLPTWERSGGESTVVSFVSVHVDVDTNIAEETDTVNFALATRIYERMCAEYVVHKMTRLERRECGISTARWMEVHVLIGRVFD